MGYILIFAGTLTEKLEKKIIDPGLQTIPHNMQTEAGNGPWQHYSFT